jgi:hypothetical protein
MFALLCAAFHLTNLHDFRRKNLITGIYKYTKNSNTCFFYIKLTKKNCTSCAKEFHFNLIFNPLKMKMNLAYLRIQHVPRSKYTPSLL